MTRDELDTFMSEAQGLERDLCRELENKAKNGWRFGWASFCMALVCVGGLIYTANKPEPEPMFFRVDNTTGDISRMTTLAEEQVTTEEVDDIYWLNKFIIAFEGYTYSSITESYNLALLLSAPSVQGQYLKRYDGKTARDYVLADKYDVKVDVKSIVPDLSKRTAVIRYSTQKVATSTANVSSQPEYWVASLRYDYIAKAKMTVGDRRLNPKAFQVLSFRADPEVVTQ